MSPSARDRDRGHRAGAPGHRGDRFVGAGDEEAADDVHDFVDGFGAVEHRLVRGDVVVRRAHLDEVERTVLHPAELVDLAVAGQDPGAVRAQLAVFDDDAELQREPEHAG